MQPSCVVLWTEIAIYIVWNKTCCVQPRWEGPVGFHTWEDCERVQNPLSYQ